MSKVNINEEVVNALTTHINFNGLDVELYPKFISESIDLVDENIETYIRGGYFDNHMSIYILIDSIEKEEILFKFPVEETETSKNKYTKEYIVDILRKLLNYDYVILLQKKEPKERFLEIDKLIEKEEISFVIKDEYKEMYESVLYLIERLKDNTIYFYFKIDANQNNKNYFEKLTKIKTLK